MNIFDFLGYGFLELCKLWVKDMKKESKLPSKYWDIAMLCSELSCIPKTFIFIILFLFQIPVHFKVGCHLDL